MNNVGEETKFAAKRKVGHHGYLNLSGNHGKDTGGGEVVIICGLTSFSEKAYLEDLLQANLAKQL